MTQKYPYPGTQAQREILRRRFQSCLEMSLSDCVDTLVSIAAGHVVVDIVKVDNILHTRFGNYEDEGMSMDEIIKEKYGEQASQLLNELL